ncbi:hypothetical protein GYMLUDRAFT_1027590, partial [Collybiopsis luxurians FD-317 M1]
YQVFPTRSVLSLTAGDMAINVTFLSPIEPDDLVLQSFPFTYIYFEASSMDGSPHSIQVYHDIGGEWVSSNTLNVIQWNTLEGNSIIYHKAQRFPFQYMTEMNDMAEDSVIYHVTNVSAVTYQTGQNTIVRSAFLNNATLANNQDLDFRGINDRWPVFAFSYDLGTIIATSSPIVWGIGLVRNPDIVYNTTAGNQNRRPYFFSRYSDVPTAMSDFIGDASNALQRAISLDNKILSDAQRISSNYSDLVSLASRQTMAGMEITVGFGSSGQVVNESDTLIFMKDTGNSQRMNPVETLYAAFPAILYINASWAGYLLEPLLQFESSGLYNRDFAAQDLGNTFPSAFGNNIPAPPMAMESSSDMLIMAWAHAIFSGDGSLLSSYVYQPLTPNGLHCSSRVLCHLTSDVHLFLSSISADGLSNVNMTNLAIKGILAIRAMAEISRTVGELDDSNTYLNIASSLVSQWQTLAGSSGHLTSTYGASSSWGLLYNLYPDKLFGFNLVDDEVGFDLSEPSSPNQPVPNPLDLY